MNQQEKEKIIRENAKHLKILNGEVGELRDEQKKTNEQVGEVKICLATVKTDVAWLKKLVIGTSVIGATVTGLIQLLK